MSFIRLIATRADVVFPRNLSPLNVLSILLLGVAIVLPLISCLTVLVLSMLIQAAFFRVMHREKVGVNKLLKRLSFLLISSIAIVVVLFQHHLL